MKILFYIDVMNSGGAQRVMSNLVNYFKRKDYEVVLINDAPIDTNVAEYDIADGVKRYYLADDFLGNPIIKNIKRMIKLRHIIKKENPKVVLSFLGNCNKRMLLSSIGLDCRKVVSVRNDPNKEYGTSTIRKFLTGQLFKLADGCVFQTEEVKDYFPLSVVRKARVIVNPVKESFFEVIRDEKNYIVTLGRLYEQKNHKLLIDAYEKIVGDIDDDLYIYGEGPLRQELEEHVRKKDLQERVFLRGNTQDVEKVLSRAKLFVLSSDYEGMPNALLEALAVGVPCISTDCPCGGPKTVITDGANGLLVPCNCVEELSDAIYKLCKDNDYREKLGRRAKENAADFKSQRILDLWEKYLLDGC